MPWIIALIFVAAAEGHHCAFTRLQLAQHRQLPAHIDYHGS
jgi:hypothetical protein